MSAAAIMLPTPSEFRKLREAGQQRQYAKISAAFAASVGGAIPGPPSSTSGGRLSPQRGLLKKKSSFNGGIKKTRSNNELAMGGRKPSFDGSVDSKGEIKRVRSVEFNTRVRVQEVETLVDVGGNANELWLQKEELKQLRQNRRVEAKQYRDIIRSRSKSPTPDSMNNTNKKQSSMLPPTCTIDKDDEGISYRGLEKYVDDRVVIRRANSREAVLDAQNQIKVMGGLRRNAKFGGNTTTNASSDDDNDETIATLYRQSSTIANMTAQQLGQLDAMDIQDYLMTPRTKKLLVKSNPGTPNNGMDGAAKSEKNPLMAIATAPML